MIRIHDVLAVFTAVLAGDLAHAQAPVLRPAREMIHVGAAVVHDVELADLDGDGDLDLYVDGIIDGEQRQGVHLYDDLGGFAELAGAVVKPAGVDSYGAAAFGDLDGDGDCDAYRVTFGTAEVLLGDGTGKLALSAGVSGWTGVSLAVAAVDLDLDGDLDLVSDDSTGGVTMRLNAHINGGSATFATLQFPVQAQSVLNAGDVAAGDVNADGFPDVVVATGGFPELVMNGPGLALVDVPAAIPHDFPGGAVQLGDLDGDGALDLACGAGVSPTVSDAPDLVYRGDGLGGFSLAAVLPVPLGATSALGLADLDGDGDLDVVLVQEHGVGPEPGSQRVVRNDGAMAFTEVTGAVKSIGSSCLSLALGDVDQDGDADLVLGQAEARFLLGDGALGFVEATSPTPWTGAKGDVQLADLDGDGDLDAWASGADAPLQRNPGNGVFLPEPAAVVLVPGGEASGAVAFDSDGDGDMDVVQAKLDADNVLYLNAGAGSFTQSTILVTSVQKTPMAAAGDVDGDGDQDLVFAGSNELFVNDGTGVLTPAPAAIPTGGPDTTTAAFADLDLDGDLELVRGSLGGATWNDYDGSPGSGYAPETELAGHHEVTDLAVFDLDADGDPDLLFGEHFGPSLLRNDLGGTFTDLTPGLPAYSPIYGSPRVATGDFDDDGDEDFVAAIFYQYEDQKLLVYLNQSGGVFTEGAAMVQGGQHVPWDVAAGDVDGDGDSDLVVTELEGRLRVFANHAQQLAWRGLPRVGKALALDVSGPASQPWALAISHGTATIPLGSYGVLHLDPAGLHVVATGVLDGVGQGLVSGMMPSGPSAVGLTVYAQGIVAPLPRLTNLEVVTLTGN